MNHFQFGPEDMKNGHPRLTVGKVAVIFSLIAGGLAIAVLFAFIFGLFVKLLWNWLMPDIFGIKQITYWQAWGLVLLSHLLIKGNWFPGNDKNRMNDGLNNTCSEHECWTTDANGTKKWEWHGCNFSNLTEAKEKASDAAKRANDELAKGESDLSQSEKD